MDSGAAAMWQMPRLTPRTLWATERYERISSELRPRSFGLPLSPTPLEAPTPTPLSISGLQSSTRRPSDGPLKRVRKTGQDLTAPGGSVASERIDVDEAVIDDAAGLSKIPLIAAKVRQNIPKT